MIEFKKSGVDYIGNIPSNWELTRLKYCLTKKDRSFNSDSPILICSNSGKVVYKTENTMGQFSEKDTMYQGVRKGDLLIHGMDTWHGAIAISDYDGKCTTVVHVCESEKDNKSFIKYFLQSLAYKGVYKIISAGVRQNTSDFRSWQKAGGIYIAKPEITIQNNIASFLDKKCDEIDKIITLIKTEIEDLEKCKISEITKIVKKGLHKSVNYKDSGIEWIGDIPSHWEVVANRYLFTIKKEIVDNPDNYQLLSLTTKGVKEKEIEDTSGKVPENYDGYQIVKINDLIMCLYDLDCSAVFSGLSKYNGMISPSYKILTPVNNSVSVRYYDYWFQFVSSERFYKQYSKSLRYTVNSDEFGMLRSILPPLQEQLEIANYLDNFCEGISYIISKKEEEIDILEITKKSLICEYATGKKEVPNE